MIDKKNRQTGFKSTVMDDDKTITLVQPREKPIIDRLVLDEEGKRPSRTRNELYKELTKNDKKMEEEDYFEYSSPRSRVTAFLIDIIFTATIIQAAIIAAPFELKLLHLFIFDKYKIEFMLGESVLMQTLIVSSIILALFFFVVIPLAFYNLSIGKKIIGLRVRGDHKYTLSIAQAFKREIIYKPIGIACLASFILPFNDKKKKALHDKLANTFVIKE